MYSGTPKTMRSTMNILASFRRSFCLELDPASLLIVCIIPLMSMIMLLLGPIPASSTALLCQMFNL